MQKCSFPECHRNIDYRATGYCRSHHQQFIKGETLHPIKRKGSGRSICPVERCDRYVHRGGLCMSHFTQRENGLEFSDVKHINKPGSGCITNGYRVLTINDKHIYEHRYIMEMFLGRKLLRSETVHHKNGNRSDNRIENLELWSKHQPNGQRVVDKIQWAIEILERYKDILHLFSIRGDMTNR